MFYFNSLYLSEEEEVPVLQGGTLVEDINVEPPVIMHRGQEGAEPHYSQGEFRTTQVYKIESRYDASRRRQKAQAATVIAREKGLGCDPRSPSIVAVDAGSDGASNVEGAPVIPAIATDSKVRSFFFFSIYVFFANDRSCVSCVHAD